MSELDNDMQQNEKNSKDVSEKQEAVEVMGEAAEEVLPAAEQEGAEEPETTDLAERLAALEKERDDYLDQWRRSAAEFQNFKKREERLRVERERNANARLLRNLLPVLDDLQRASQHVPEEINGNEWVNGMLAIERKLWNVLEQEGVSVIEAAPGSDFDPMVHEALISQESEEFESGSIVSELERGYRLKETVLRPARVTVAR